MVQRCRLTWVRMWIMLTAVTVVGCADPLLHRTLSLSEVPAGQAMVEKLPCGDFLRELSGRVVPDVLEFLDCSAGSGQVIWQARYRVPGDFASQAEEFLHREFQMPKLQFVCCVWEPHGAGGGRFTAQGHYFAVTMGNAETLISDRREWGDLPFFYVEVEMIVM